MAFEDDAFCLGIFLGEFREFQTKLEAGAAPAKPADLLAIDLACQVLAGRRRGDRDDGVWMHVVHMGIGKIGVERRVDGGGARIEREGAMGQIADHLILVLGAAIEVFQGFELALIERRKAVALHRADIAARSLYPKDGDVLAGEWVLFGHLRGGVAAPIIGDPLIRAEKIGTVEKPSGLIERRCMGLVPKGWQQSGRTSFVSLRHDWSLLDDCCAHHSPKPAFRQSIRSSSIMMRRSMTKYD